MVLVDLLRFDILKILSSNHPVVVNFVESLVHWELGEDQVMLRLEVEVENLEP
eukprot:SAG31_NODE_2893_length_4940_cov_237.861805_3_plen_53_part_00